jgi:hypothetical protein
LSIESILTELKTERRRIDEAIAALEGITRPIPSTPAPAAKPIKRRRRKMSAEARQRLSEMRKAWWAARKKGKNSGKRQSKTA